MPRNQAAPAITPDQFAARNAFARLSGEPPGRWSIVTAPELETWYDFFDTATGKYGQCRKRRDGAWLQTPLGANPVVLAYDGPRNRNEKT